MDIDELLEAAAEEKVPKFGIDIEEAILSVLIDHPEFCKVDYLRPDYFIRLECQWIVAEILNHVEKHGVVPTRPILRDIVLRKLTEDDPFDVILDLIARKSKPREIPYIKAKMSEWLQYQAYGRLFSDEGQVAYVNRDYDYLINIIRDAEKYSLLPDDEPFGFANGADFLSRDLNFTWYIEDIFVGGQPFLLGGKKKTLKTGMLCDMALGLASGTPFLGHFDVPEPRRVAFFSCESGEHDIQHRLRTIARLRDIQDASLENLYLSFERPRLSNPNDLKRISRFAEDRKIEVLIVDPLYLTLLTGNSEASSSNLYDMGSVFAQVADACKRGGATPILCHHFKKTIGDELDLDNFSFTGAAEFARQSLLVGRRGAYSGPRTNQLTVRTHGYSRGERYSVQVDEGDLDNPAWGVTIEKEQEIRALTQRSKLDRAVAELRNTMLDMQEDDPDIQLTKNRLREALGWNGSKITKVLEQAADEDFVEEYKEGAKTCYRRVL